MMSHFKKTKVLFFCWLLLCLCFFSQTAFSLIYGDADNNGTVNIVDALVTARYVAGLIPASAINLEAADAYKDGNVTISDALVIARYTIKLITALPYSTPTPTRTPTPPPTPTPTPTKVVVDNCTGLMEPDFMSGFGKSVSLSADGKTALIGDPGEPYNNINGGAAYLYQWNNGFGWEQLAKFFASDHKLGAGFGLSVSLSADANIFLVGAQGASGSGSISTGAGYIYRWNAETDVWDETKLCPSDLTFQISFGGTVALSGNGNTAIIGVFARQSGVEDPAAAYIYRWNAELKVWEEKKLVSDSSYPGEWQMQNVAVSADGNTALVSIIDVNETSTMSAYIYRWNSTANQWGLTKILTSATSSIYRFFGGAVISADGNTIAIDSAEITGPHYIDVFKWNSTAGIWEEQKKLSTIVEVPSADSDYFGYSLSISADGNKIIVGAPGYGGSYTPGAVDGYGSAVLYQQNSLTSQWEATRLLPIAKPISAYMGSNVALSADGSTALLGSDLNYTGGPNWVYIYNLQ